MVKNFIHTHVQVQVKTSFSVTDDLLLLIDQESEEFLF